MVIVEKSPSLRDAGYMMDFFGPGYDVAELLGLMDQIERIHYPIEWFEFLKPDGTRKFALDYQTFSKWFDGRHRNFMRGDLERLLYDNLVDRGAVVFGRSIVAADMSEDGVRATLTDGAVLQGDLLVGADGIHSNVRRLVFGEEGEFAHYLGFHTIAFILDDREVGTAPTDTFSTLTEPGRQAAIYPIRDDRTAAFFAHRSALAPSSDSIEEAREELATQYGSMDWVVPRLIERAADLSDIYYDGVSQIIMPSWKSGKAVLIGDAAYCVSLLAGQGSAMAMLGASILAGQLDQAGGDIERAFQFYERRMRPYVERSQKAGRDFANQFIPDNEVLLHLRDFIMHYSDLPPMSWLVKRNFAGGRIDKEDADLIGTMGPRS